MYIVIYLHVIPAHSSVQIMGSTQQDLVGAKQDLNQGLVKIQGLQFQVLDSRCYLAPSRTYLGPTGSRFQTLANSGTTGSRFQTLTNLGPAWSRFTIYTNLKYSVLAILEKSILKIICFLIFGRGTYFVEAECKFSNKSVFCFIFIVHK